MNLVPFGRENGAPAHRDFGFNTLQREVDRVFDSFARSVPMFNTRPAYPSMDVLETDKEIEIWCELPGLEEKDVQVSLADGVLTIEGEKQAERDEKGRAYQLLERSYGAFSRSIALPAKVDPDSVKAIMKKGVLKLTVSKPKSAAAHQIEIKPAN